MENRDDSSCSILLAGCLSYLYKSIMFLIEMCKEFSWVEHFWSVKPVCHISNNVPMLDSFSVLAISLLSLQDIFRSITSTSNTFPLLLLKGVSSRCFRGQLFGFALVTHLLPLWNRLIAENSAGTSDGPVNSLRWLGRYHRIIEL